MLHMSCMFGGCKLKLAVFNELLEKWRLKTHIPYDECTNFTKGYGNATNFTSKWVFGPSVANITDWLGVCRKLFGNVSTVFSGCQINID